MKGFFEPLVVPPEVVSGLDGFVMFMAETFNFLSDLVEIACEPRECRTRHFWGGQTRLAVVGSKIETS